MLQESCKENRSAQNSVYVEKMICDNTKVDSIEEKETDEETDEGI